MKNVYLVQVNNTYGKNAFLPYSVGLLQAYALTNPIIKENYAFKGFVYLREDIPSVLTRLDNPRVFGISCYIWNFEYSMALAKAVKAQFPDCLIILGGPHVPVLSDNFFKEHPYADLLVHYEGELAFHDILIEYLNDKPDYTNIPGLSVQIDGNSLKTKSRERITDLSILPSPYLTGVFDNIINDPYDFHASQETNRGCPYSAAGQSVIAFPDRIFRFEEEEYEEFSAIECPTKEHVHKLGKHDKRIICQGEQEALRIHFSNGLGVTLGLQHPVNKVENENRHMTSASNLKIGDWVAIERDVNNVTNYCKIDHDQEEFDPRETRINWPEYLDENLAWIIGFLIGDGCLSKEGSQALINWAVTDKTAPELLNKCEKVFGVKPKITAFKHTVKASSATILSRHLWRFFKNSIGIKHNHEKLEAPELIRKSPKTVVYAFLEGLWAADGYTPKNKGKASYLTTISSRLAEDVATLINWIGDVSMVRKINRVLPRQNIYRVEWHKQCCDDRLYGTPCIRSQIPLSYSIKRQHLIHNKYMSNGAYKEKAKKNHSVVCRRKLKETFPEHPLLGDNWSYVKVTNIEEIGKQILYDAHLEGKNQFTANCISVHNCTFCDWGSNVMAKLKSFELERLVSEIQWFAEHKIDLLYNCDANFGIFARDIELTQKMAEIKAKTGFPNKFRAAYAKNSNDTVFQIAKILHHAGMNKGITLSFQSMNNKTLEIIKRKNIKIENFTDIIQRYRSEGIATYSEIIIGLPGETYDTFADGLNLLVTSGQHDSIQIYTCEVLPNSEMNHPLYREVHKIQSVRTPVLFFHGTPSNDPHCEQYEMVIGTATLPTEDWLKCQQISWAFQAFHCLGLLQSVALYFYKNHGLSYRNFYERVLEYGLKNPETVIGEAVKRATTCFENLRNGKTWGFVDERFGPIIWPPEEAGFLTCMTEKERFYSEVQTWLKTWENIDNAQVDDLINYQSSIAWSPYQQAETTLSVNCNIHEHLESAYFNETLPLQTEPKSYLIKSSKNYDDFETYAREVVWYGRKGGRFRHTDIKTLGV